MAHVRTLSGMNDNGFDESRSLLVLPAGKTSTLYLVEGGSDELTTEVDDPTVVSVDNWDQTKSLSNDKRLTTWERVQEIHKLTVKGLKVGTTTLRALRGRVGSTGSTRSRSGWWPIPTTGSPARRGRSPPSCGTSSSRCRCGRPSCGWLRTR